MKFDFGQIIEMFNKLDVKIRYGVFVGILLLIFFLDFFTIMAFQWGSIRNMENEQKSLKQNIERLQSDLLRVNQFKNNLQTSKAQLEALNKKIHSVGEISSIMEDISSLANEVGVKIDQLTPQQDAQKSAASNETVKYYFFPIVIQGTSSYHAFGHFLNRLELEKLLFIVSNLSIEDRDGDVRHHALNANLKIVLSEKNTDGKQK